MALNDITVLQEQADGSLKETLVTPAGRDLLLAATVQAQRTALDTFVSVANFASLPVSGNFQRVYLALDTAKTYVWNGSEYTETSPNTHTRAGINNTNVGETALASPSLSGSNNTANGSNALLLNTTGSGNVGIGANTLIANTGGNNNIAIGRSALGNCASPDANIGIGTQAGITIATGGSNIIIGHEANVDDSNRQRCIVLGRSAVSPAVDGSLAIGGTGGNLMGNLVTSSSTGTAANKDLIIYLNGVRYYIALKT